MVLKNIFAIALIVFTVPFIIGAINGDYELIAKGFIGMIIAQELSIWWDNRMEKHYSEQEVEHMVNANIRRLK